MRIVGLVGSAEAGGRTSTAVAALLAGTEADTELIELCARDQREVAGEMGGADAVVLGSPVYRATCSSLLKSALEATERGKGRETSAPLQGKVAATVLTGAAPQHFLAMNDLRNVLAGFFAVQVLSPGLYLDHSDYLDRTTLTDGAAALAAAHGAALADLTLAVRGSAVLAGLTAQV